MPYLLATPHASGGIRTLTPSRACAPRAHVSNRSTTEAAGGAAAAENFGDCRKPKGFQFPEQPQAAAAAKPLYPPGGPQAPPPSVPTPPHRAPAPSGARVPPNATPTPTLLPGGLEPPTRLRGQILILVRLPFRHGSRPPTFGHPLPPSAPHPRMRWDSNPRGCYPAAFDAAAFGRSATHPVGLRDRPVDPTALPAHRSSANSHPPKSPLRPLQPQCRGAVASCHCRVMGPESYFRRPRHLPPKAAAPNPLFPEFPCSLTLQRSLGLPG